MKINWKYFLNLKYFLKIYSILAIYSGIIADIDIESEKYRYLGTLRYDLYGAYLWLAYR